MAKNTPLTISQPIPSGSRILHHGPIIINADIEDDVTITAAQGGISVRPNATGRIPQIGNKVTLVSQGFFSPNVSGPNAMPKNTPSEIKEYRISLTQYFDTNKGISDIPVSGIIIDDRITAGAEFKASSTSDPNGVGIRAVNTGANMRIRTDRPFIGGNNINPDIKAGSVNMGAVTGGRIETTGRIKVDSATYHAKLRAGTFIMVRQAENATLHAPLVSYISKTSQTIIRSSAIQQISPLAFDGEDANLQPELKPKDP